MPESLILNSPEQTEAAAARFAAALNKVRPEQLVVHLEGTLGAGKTTFTRGVLRALGHSGRVPSPTYTLIEPYECAGYRISHLDLYRLQDGAELEFLGLDELTGPGSVLLIEWPSRAAGYLQSNDIEIKLTVIPEGRALELSAASALGEAVAEEFVRRSTVTNP
ncbi:MAG: tRNA (adenosine(37)-N6)-threonylcarbamoyltransferase complex ATPase subunit type 1 TsaE [Gammaproteobacteria bacterium]